MARQVAIFVHGNPYPPKYGILGRMISMIRGFHELGYQVHLLSHELTRSAPWMQESIDYLEKSLVKSVRVYKATARDERIRKLVGAACARLTHQSPSVFSVFHTPPDMRSWFRREVEAIAPELIMINYAQYDPLLDHARFKTTRRVMDATDLQSLNLAMQRKLHRLLSPQPIDPAQADESLIREDFYHDATLKVDRREFRIYDHYSKTIAITKAEADIIRKGTHKTEVAFIPMTYETPEVRNSYAGRPLFQAGPNDFNLQGYVYFARRVLPLVLKSRPDFVLQMTGSLPRDRVVPVPGIENLGFIPDLLPCYEKSRFVINPVFGGTGQQVKIVEAMAHGVPVVALRSAAERSPMVHGVSGLVAEDAAEFAEQVCRLWSDPALCRSLGRAARETIRERYSQRQLNNELSKLFTPAGVSSAA